MLSTVKSSLLDEAYFNRVLSYNPDAYWPLWELSGATAADLGASGLDSAYSAAGVTLGQTGVGDGRTAPAFSGANSHVLIGDGGLGLFNNIWNGDKGSLIMWGRVDAAARWTDGSTYRYLWHVRSTTDATYYITFGKNTTNHQLEWRRRSGGAILSKTHTFAPTGPTGWFLQAMTWDIAADSVACYVGLDRVLTTVYSGTFGGVGNTAWGVNPVAPGGTTVLCAGSTTLQEWIGFGAHAAYWGGKVLTAEQVEILAAV